MSNKARKQRKHLAEKFVRIPKVATPVVERSSFKAASDLKQSRILKARGIESTEAAE